VYVQALSSGDVMIRAAGASGLERLARPSDFSALMDAYERARSDTLNDAALAVIDALAALSKKGIPVSRSFLLRFPRSPDPVVRQRFAARIDSVAWSRGPEARVVRPLAFYEEVVRTLVAPVLAGEEPPGASIRTAKGDIAIELAAADAPLTVHNFLELMRTGYYPDTRQPRDARWHRVVPNFVLQDGDRRGDGAGGPGYAIRDEINRLRYGRGVVGMALSGPDTGGSQFFITLSPQPHLDGGYTIFGRVVGGMDVADRIVQDDRILAIQPVAR
jgi:cyclophilin family peptidyl-prolyl cis-trans isomerase